MSGGESIALIGSDPVISDALIQLLTGLGYRPHAVTPSTKNEQIPHRDISLIVFIPELETGSPGMDLADSILEELQRKVPVVELTYDPERARIRRGEPVAWPCMAFELKLRIDDALQRHATE